MKVSFKSAPNLKPTVNQNWSSCKNSLKTYTKQTTNFLKKEKVKNEKADNIRYNEETNELQLLANGNEIGNKVTIKTEESTLDDLENGVPVVDFGSVSGGDTSVDEEVEDNVIEF